MVEALRIGVYAGVMVLLVGLFLMTCLANGFRLPDETKERVAITPATTVSQFYRHFIAGLFHNNLLHIAFNLLVFTAGYWLATQRSGPFTVVGSAYALGILSVFLAHIFFVIPLARWGLPCATRALDLPLVGFSVIAYATLGAGLHALPKSWQIASAGAILVLEVGAAVLATLPFVSVYHLMGVAFGFYVSGLSKTAA